MIRLEDVRAAAARIDGHVRNTPLERSAWLSAPAGVEVLVKQELRQATGSYKLRGAYNALLRLEPGADRTVVTASAGNHGRALAHAARACAVRVVAFVPRDAPRVKLDAMRALGAELHECADYDQAEASARDWAVANRLPYISPYAHPDVIAGAGTVALEILDERPDVRQIVVALGGGGLAAGTGIVARDLGGRTSVTAAEAAASSPFTASLAAGRIVRIEIRPTLADGLAGNLDPSTPTFAMVRAVVDRVVTIPESELRHAVREAWRHGLPIEGAAGAAVAAVLAGHTRGEGPVAVVASGGNIDTDVLRSLG